MRRRIQVPNELYERSHVFAPRKFRSYGAPGVFLQQEHGLPSFPERPREENHHRHWTPPPSGPAPKRYHQNFAWLEAQIGKVFIPNGFQPLNPEKNNWVTEKDIAIYAKPYDFDLHYQGRTKPMADYLPNRLNVVLDLNNVIREVWYV